MARAKWARHYKRVKSAAHPIITRKRRREEMAKRRTKTTEKETAAHKAAKKAPGISPEQYFMLRSGTAIKSIGELAMMLDSMSDDDFNYHVNEAKNDFSNWIGGVFGDNDLAEALMPIKDKKESQIMLLKHAVTKKHK